MTGNYYYVDLGSNKVTAYSHSDQKWFEFKASELFKWSTSLPSGSILIGENAHFACPRTEKSKAQYFEADELLRWYAALEDNGITLRLFAQKDTEKFRRSFLGVDKSDKNDILAMVHAMHEVHPKLRKRMEHLQKPKTSFETRPDKEEGDVMREILTAEKNLQRVWKYNEFHYKDGDPKKYQDETVEWLIDNLEELAKALPEDTAEAFGFDKIYGKNGELLKRPVFTKLKTAQVLAVLLIHMNLDGTRRVRPSTGKPCGWKFVKQNLILEHPYRPKRGGVVRASLKWDGARHYISGKCGTKTAKGQPSAMSKFTEQNWLDFKEHRNAFSKHTKILWSTIREMLTERDSVCYSYEKEFTSLSHELQEV
jgi:hypothetical protein